MSAYAASIRFHGSCTVALPIQEKTPAGTLYTCQNGTWGEISGGVGGLPSGTGIVKVTSGTGGLATAGTDYPGFATANDFENTLASTAGQNNQSQIFNGNSLIFATQFQGSQNGYISGTYYFSDEADFGLTVPSTPPTFRRTR